VDAGVAAREVAGVLGVGLPGACGVNAGAGEVAVVPGMPA
jgi:hypothetical protein